MSGEQRQHERTMNRLTDINIDTFAYRSAAYEPVGSEERADALQHSRLDPVPDMAGPTLSREHAGLGQHPQMVADSWLRQPDPLDQLADRHLTRVAGADEADQLQTRRVGDGLEQGGQLLRLLGGQTRGTHRGRALVRIGGRGARRLLGRRSVATDAPRTRGGSLSHALRVRTRGERVVNPRQIEIRCRTPSPGPSDRPSRVWFARLPPLCLLQ